jgi:hypothetical protein
VNTVKAFTGILAVAALLGCASSGSTTGNRALPDRVTASEIATTSTSNAWDLINRLRPQWLRAQNVGSISGRVASTQAGVVYVDGIRFGDTSSLRTLTSSGITNMQWLDAARAQTLLPGLSSESIAGAIVISTH